jgi:diguanylate cyclase (GGDEF)-like protein/PAS domain S-box-containing protein
VGGEADDLVRMRLARRRRDAECGADRRSGTDLWVFVGGGGVLAAVCASLVAGLVPAPSVAVAGVVVVVVAAVALVGLAFGQRPARASASRFGRRFGRDFDHVPVGMMTLTPQLRVVWVNAAVCVLLGRDAEELAGRSILEFTHPDDVQRSVQWSESRRNGNVEAPLAKRYIRPDGSIVEAAAITTLVEPKRGEPYFFSQVLDKTEQRRAERQKAVIAELGRRALECTDVIALMGEAMRAVRETLGTATCVTTRRLASGEIRFVAADGERFDPVPAGQPSQTAFTLAVDASVLSNDLTGETRFSAAAAVFEKGLQRSVSVPVPERSGARHVIVTHAHASARPFTVEDTRFLEAVAHVIAGALDRAATEEELRRRALEDPLTGLANRALVSSQLEAELRHARRLGNRVCVLVLDLDRFKVLNDTLGHTAGDTLLRLVAARLTACVREEDLVARPGGDEFTVVCTRTASDLAIAEVAARLVESVLEPFEIDGREVFITASVGVAVSEQGRETPEELLRDAYVAMHRAKELGGGRVEAFDAALRHHLLERMAIEDGLRHALQREELELHYQPLIDLIDERVVGFEALLRWRHPERGLIAPGQFIPIAEETGLIVAIGSWVLDRVCAQLAQWPQEIHASANLSARQIHPKLVLEVEQLLARHAITPGRLVLEITESLVLDPSIKPVIASLRGLGVQLALDDFGTGYSSLGSLQRFPLDLVKLDRTLIDTLSDGRGVAVVRAAIELGRALGVPVIAEGIEDQAQLDTLRELGCALGQGFLFARPLPLADAQRLIQTSARDTPPVSVSKPTLYRQATKRKVA